MSSTVEGRRRTVRLRRGIGEVGGDPGRVAGVEPRMVEEVGGHLHQGVPGGALALINDPHTDKLADSTRPEQLLRSIGRQTDPRLVIDRQFHAGAVTGRHHRIRLGQRQCNRLLAQHATHAGGGTGQGCRGVLGSLRGDCHDVQRLAVEHLLVVGISVLRGNAELLAAFVEGWPVGVGERHQLHSRCGHQGGDVMPAHPSTADQSGAIRPLVRFHTVLSLPRLACSDPPDASGWPRHTRTGTTRTAP